MIYKSNIVVFWGFTVFVLIWWWSTGRHFEWLGLVFGWSELVLSVIFTLVATTILYLAIQWFLRLDQHHPDFKHSFLVVPDILPRNPSQWRWFTALSLSAGFCEELLYRAYLVWYLQHFIGPTLSLTIAVILFGACHAYQGKKGVIAATILGALFSLIFLWSGSLWTAMILHALINIFSGTYGYYVLGRDDT